MFRPFRLPARRRSAQASPPDTGSEQESYDRAWADYVEWSGLDEAGLPEAPRKDGRP